MSASNVTEKLELIGIKLKNYRSCQMFPEDGECEYLKIGKFTTLIGKNDVGKLNRLVIRSINPVSPSSSIKCL